MNPTLLFATLVVGSSMVLSTANATGVPFLDQPSPPLETLILQQDAATVRGTVRDADSGELIPGVNVRLKNTSKGTITDIDGKFEIDVEGPESVLVFSFIGYVSQEATVGNQGIMDISLHSDLESLEEVVVVGYGTQVKRNVTGSVSSVEVDQLETQPNTNIGQALRGRVAGVQFTDNGRPGQGGSVLVRGQRSITASNDPLIILDGAFFNGELSDINPSDVASMEVLKDASASAIYGSRAANGVILITSKKGTSEKPLIRINSYAGVSDWSYKMPLYSPDEYLQRRLDFRFQNQPNDPTVPVRELLSAEEREMYDAGRTVDPWDEISQNASQKSINLSVSGQSDKTNYFISGSYVDEEGLIYGDRASRISMRLNLTNQITNWLKIGANTQYVQRDLSGVEASELNGYWLTPYAKMYYDDAKTDPVPYPTGDNLVNNPMFNSLLMDNEQISNNLMANLFAIIDVPFLEGLSYRFNYNPNIRWSNDYSFQPIYQRNGINNPGTGRKYNQNRKNWQFENIVTYTKEINDHGFDVTLLYGRNHAFREGTFAEGRGFVNDANGWHNLEIAETQLIETEGAQQDGVSSMARLNYRFKNRYMITLTARRDGASVFGEDKKFGTFPSVALGWVMSDEAFMMNQKTIDMLKLRLSYGEVGNQAVSAYRSLDRSNSFQYVFGSETYTALFPNPDYMPNPSLGWETTASFNAAVDFELWKGRLSGTAEFYDMTTTDLLLARSLPAMTGFWSTTANLGQTSNTGFELTLTGGIIQKKDFSWSSTLTFSTNKNRIDHLYYADADGDGQEDDDLGNRWFIGQPIGVTYDYAFDGIYQEGDEMPDGYQAGWVRVKDLNSDGQISPDDRTVLGQTAPKYRMGLNNQFNYKNWSLSVFINAMTGWEAQFNLLDVSTQTGNSYPGRSVNFLNAGYWTPENQSSERPGLTYTNPLGRGYYLSRDFVRIQDATLAYSFPEAMLEKWRMSGLKVYVSGRNLATFTDWLGPDPESGNNTITNLYPTPRTIIAGLNISF
ncbi:SusC/RagA family TonB-linked outer membrane protein [Echinicola strongylocentroti]|uniref:SusC/RagA family TonB-linked outer membrane protein n=1 Tax=Echinicola strongylocentroti TaxID=1795355 RepID=A0A2Z4IKW9_9BACT|nr:TonB-dependent receptor [Echinicola strongylocentroti]AWW31198.1 SusC/RagA family TonB-linked outer membrane protein [Echinicola strongylocentroti]